MDPILGQIILWPAPWVPEGWQLCDGTLLNIQQYTALYSLIGITYGGNGSTNFAVPDLRGKIPMGTTSMTQVAKVAGETTSSTVATAAGGFNLTVDNLPAHTHTATFTGSSGTAAVSIAIPADGTGSDTNAPGNTVVLGKASAGVSAAKVYSSGAPNTTLEPFDVNVPTGGSGNVVNASTGGGAPVQFAVNVPVTVSTLQPSLTMNFIIAVTGIYPSRP